MNTMTNLIKSWAMQDTGVNKNEKIIEWIDKKNSSINVNIIKSTFYNDSFWYYDKHAGEIRNKNNSFFQIKGLQKIKNGKVLYEQPIILQNEIGYLGMICQEINGILHFLMQSKIEPGNINKVQISPTIQATKSNFTQKHGGNKPPYLEYFINSEKYEIIVDQIQSEQSSRFYKKRNRNIIIKVDEEVEVLDSHMWMTIGQIKELLKVDNLVNMDTRTVLSCIPFYKAEADETLFKDKSLYNSIFNNDSLLFPKIYNKINNYKMFDEEESIIVPLHSLKSWEMRDEEIISLDKGDFKVIFCDIEIEGREVKKWSQPLFEATGKCVLGLFTCNDNGIRRFLVKLTSEIGCFDKIELGPTIQLEPSEQSECYDEVTRLFLTELRLNNNVIYNVTLSEEGGRFYQEENQNCIIEIDKSDINDLTDEYLWLDYKTLNILVQSNNCLNIQLRNLLSLLEV